MDTLIISVLRVLAVKLSERDFNAYYGLIYISLVLVRYSRSLSLSILKKYQPLNLRSHQT